MKRAHVFKWNWNASLSTKNRKMETKSLALDSTKMFQLDLMTKDTNIECRENNKPHSLVTDSVLTWNWQPETHKNNLENAYYGETLWKQ